jgi:hypothetical protein
VSAFELARLHPADELDHFLVRREPERDEMPGPHRRDRALQVRRQQPGEPDRLLQPDQPVLDPEGHQA